MRTYIVISVSLSHNQFSYFYVGAKAPLFENNKNKKYFTHL